MRAADVRAIIAAPADAGHVFDEHVVLVPCAVVVHHREHRQLMMGGSPQNTRGVVEIAIGLDINDDSIARLRGEGSANRCRCAVTHTACALASQIAIRLIVIPKLRVMARRRNCWRRRLWRSLHS